MHTKNAKTPVGFLVSLTLVILSVIVVSWLLGSYEMSVSLRLALAVIPPTIWVFCLIFLMRLLRQLDELQRRIHLEALAIAFPSLAVAIMTCEYLRKAGFITALKPDHVLMMMMALLLTSYLITWRRYQ
jgi:hypothetical protein